MPPSYGTRWVWAGRSGREHLERVDEPGPGVLVLARRRQVGGRRLEPAGDGRLAPSAVRNGQGTSGGDVGRRERRAGEGAVVGAGRAAESDRVLDHGRDDAAAGRDDVDPGSAAREGRAADRSEERRV